ncbi:histidine phosphatase family protein [Paenibacillus sp. p3-SID867]|uniref:histidine phosphatase family protein n=1 Tax=Paenibacillus sp. p3-SID867 TaxID=2916363 RepID=UPI0021A7E3C9|nr:histidine phosphatase family protein [Paenibacillus sp. p3-SID867]MCT1402059.1 histidine phosphatase family protein [Paenibacillus sp. p3-SID867]
MSTEFYLVRHAEKEKRVGDVSISPEGIKQARKTANHLSKMSIDKMISSPLNRAKQTAQIVAEAIHITVSEDSRLRERANWGDSPGQTFEEFVEMWNRCTKERDYMPPVGDSARRAGERLASCLLELSHQHPYETIVIVTHGGLITDFMVNEFTEEELNHKQPNFIIAQSNLVPECSVTHIRCWDGRFTLIDFANTAHLTR